MPNREIRVRVDKLAEDFSARPDRLYETMIEVERPATPPQPLLSSVSQERISSLGDLDRFPPEINHNILSMLDPKSLANVSRVSSRGNALVESSVAFKNLVSRAPEVFVALRMTGLSGRHSINKLHDTMKEHECANCTRYGPFLFLPTCERCCWDCLLNEPVFRVFLHDQAAKYFGLSPRDLEKLPTLRVIPGKYGMQNQKAPTCSVVSVKEAKELAIKVHGSEDKLVQVMEERCETYELLAMGRFLMGEEALKGKDLRAFPIPWHIPKDSFLGMASMPFPSMSSSNRFESGLWCRGCEAINAVDEYSQRSNTELAKVEKEREGQPCREEYGG